LNGKVKNDSCAVKTQGREEGGIDMPKEGARSRPANSPTGSEDQEQTPMTYASNIASPLRFWGTRYCRVTLAAFLLMSALGLTALPIHAQENPAPSEAPAVQQTAPATQAPEPATTPTAPRATGEATTPAEMQQAQPPADTATPPEAEETVIGDEIVPAGQERDSNLPHDLSPWGMFMAADWVVKGVMIGLAFASLLTWTVWVAKSLEIAGAKARLRTALKAIYQANSLEDAQKRLERRGGTGAALVRATVEEVKLSEPVIDHMSADGLKERVASRLSRIQAQSGRRLMRGTGVLATIGSTAPFVGLFGTVWGIMNSFIGISEAQTTNLAVVAPGIAEALLATAIGLVAAIPAVMIYNVFARSITGYKQALGDAVAGIERLVSRDLDFRKLGRLSAAHAARQSQATTRLSLAEAAE
jgi:biopolymer transport protein ExbB